MQVRAQTALGVVRCLVSGGYPWRRCGLQENSTAVRREMVMLHEPSLVRLALLVSLRGDTAADALA
jgi:hypothetical protein